MISTLFAVGALLPLVSATYNTYHVIVGGPGLLKYTPPYVHAQAGDVVRFWFQQKNHSVTQSSFEYPCTKWESGFDSGFMPVDEENLHDFPYWDLNIHDTSPIWAYCMQGDHCSKGMVFAVNPPDHKFDEFQQKAVATAASHWKPGTQAGAEWSDPKVHHVTVGGKAGNIFTPEYVHAKPGEKVVFEFQQKNHSVTQSSFDDPCSPLHWTASGNPGFDSGFMPVPPDQSYNFPTWELTVHDEKPVWAYCRQTNHCNQDGMVFAINPETEHTSFNEFKKKATHNTHWPEATTTTWVDPTATWAHPTTTTHAPAHMPKDWRVIVGGQAGNVYTPPYIHAKPGDTVTFVFQQKNHTVTQSSFEYPCQKLKAHTAPILDTGFMPVPEHLTEGFPTVVFRVKDEKPLWAYCQQGTHCKDGMVFAINPPEQGNTFEAFKTKAKESGGSDPSADPGSSWKGDGISPESQRALSHLAGAFVQY